MSAYGRRVSLPTSLLTHLTVLFPLVDTSIPKVELVVQSQIKRYNQASSCSQLFVWVYKLSILSSSSFTNIKSHMLRVDGDVEGSIGWCSVLGIVGHGGMGERRREAGERDSPVGAAVGQ